MLDSGKVQSLIVAHIEELDKMILAMTDAKMVLPVSSTSVALMQAKSAALVALSNTKAHRIISK
jgi:hypothetical protein